MMKNDDGTWIMNTSKVRGKIIYAMPMECTIIVMHFVILGVRWMAVTIDTLIQLLDQLYLRN